MTSDGAIHKSEKKIEKPLSLATQNYRPLANPLYVPGLAPGPHELSLELLDGAAGDKFKLYAVLSC